jgi:hypothetical protein
MAGDKSGRQFKLPNRYRYSVWIDGRLQNGGVSAATETAAVEAACLRWEVRDKTRIVVKRKYPTAAQPSGGPTADPQTAPSTPVDALVYKMARQLLGWTNALIESRSGIARHQRIDLEGGRASAVVKEVVFRLFAHEGVPLEELSRVAAHFLAQRRSRDHGGPP